MVEKKLFYENREIIELLECKTLASYVIIFKDNMELKLIPYIHVANILKGDSYV